MTTETIDTAVIEMEELVNKLAELQAELKAEEAKADEASALTDASIADVKDELAELGKERAFERRQYIQSMQEINATIKETETQIIDEWDGEKKTIVLDAGTLKLRTTQSLVIENKTLVLTGLLDHTSVKDVAMNYIKGFDLTAVKKYMGVLSLPMGAAYIKRKTTVKLERK